MKYSLFLGVLSLFFVVNEVNAEEICFENKVCYDVKIASEPEDLQKGLMWVKKLPKNEGMLFDFRRFRGNNLSMWMKNTYIPLDMIFIGCDNKIKDIYKNAKPLSLDKISTNLDFCYVLEVNAKEAQNNSLVIGDTMRYTLDRLKEK